MVRGVPRDAGGNLNFGRKKMPGAGPVYQNFEARNFTANQALLPPNSSSHPLSHPLIISPQPPPRLSFPFTSLTPIPPGTPPPPGVCLFSPVLCMFAPSTVCLPGTGLVVRLAVMANERERVVSSSNLPAV